MKLSRKMLLSLLERQEVPPRLLAQRYPHVLDKILDTWHSPEKIEACFQELMLADPRRKDGFPPEVMTEIFALAKLYDRANPKQASSAFDFWNRANGTTKV